MPVACLAIAALVAVAVARIARGAALVAVVAVVLLFADLRLGVSSYRSVRADSANAAYAALRSQPPGRLLELPVLHPSVAHGSLYLYYDMQARRERPSGYSTVAPKAAANLALRLEPLSCGEWRPGTERVLGDLGVRYIAVHGGIEPAQSWFAWRELTARGWGVLARDGRIATFARGRGRRAARAPRAPTANRLLPAMERPLPALPPRRLLDPRRGRPRRAPGELRARPHHDHGRRHRPFRSGRRPEDASRSAREATVASRHGRCPPRRPSRSARQDRHDALAEKLLADYERPRRGTERRGLSCF